MSEISTHRSVWLCRIIIRMVCVFFLISISLACKKKLQSDHYPYYQNFDALKGWFPTPTWLSSEIITPSGEYCAFTDSVNPYSPTLKLKFKDFDSSLPRKIKASAWIYTSTAASDGGLCFQIKNEQNENRLWISKSIKQCVTKEKFWTKVEIETPITKEMFSPENELSLYLWNTGKDKIFVDDFYLEFFRQ